MLDTNGTPVAICRDGNTWQRIPNVLPGNAPMMLRGTPEAVIDRINRGPAGIKAEFDSWMGEYAGDNRYILNIYPVLRWPR